MLRAEPEPLSVEDLTAVEVRTRQAPEKTSTTKWLVAE